MASCRQGSARHIGDTQTAADAPEGHHNRVSAVRPVRNSAGSTSAGATRQQGNSHPVRLARLALPVTGTLELPEDDVASQRLCFRNVFGMQSGRIARRQELEVNRAAVAGSDLRDSEQEGQHGSETRRHAERRKAREEINAKQLDLIAAVVNVLQQRCDRCGVVSGLGISRRMAVPRHNTVVLAADDDVLRLP